MIATLQLCFLGAVALLVIGGALHWACEMVSAFKRERRLGRRRAGRRDHENVT